MACESIYLRTPGGNVSGRAKPYRPFVPSASSEARPTRCRHKRLYAVRLRNVAAAFLHSRPVTTPA